MSKTIKTIKTSVAVFGSGFIGLDLIKKIKRSPYLNCTILFCRTKTRYIERMAEENNIRLVSEFPSGFKQFSDEYEIIFDATSAISHEKYSKVFTRLGKTIINLTPAKQGDLCIPTLNLNELLSKDSNYFNMISCGGQAGIPIAEAIYRIHPSMEYLELVSSMSSKSIGPGSRINIDEYIETTEKGISSFLKNLPSCKVLLNINHASPPVNMKVTIFAKIKAPKIIAIKNAVKEVVIQIQKHVPDYKLLVEPWINGDHVMVMIEVRGKGDFLPKYAGNLDIINCAAIATAEDISIKTSDEVSITEI